MSASLAVRLACAIDVARADAVAELAALEEDFVDADEAVERLHESGLWEEWCANHPSPIERTAYEVAFTFAMQLDPGGDPWCPVCMNEGTGDVQVCGECNRSPE